MKQHLTISQLKSISRGQLLGNYGIAVYTEITVKILLFSIASVASFVTDSSSIFGNVFYYAASFLINVFEGILLYGLAKFYLNLVCNGNHTFSDVLSGFRTHADKALLIRLRILLYEVACMLPAGIAYLLYNRLQSAILFLLTSIFFIVGMIFCLYFLLTLSQVYYIMLDFPVFSVKQVLQTSHEMMKGNKGRLFYLYVSLIPYYLLSVLSCGITLFWIIPYQRTILTNFYLDIASSN